MRKVFSYFIVFGIVATSAFVIFILLTLFTIRKVIIVTTMANIHGLEAIEGQSLLFINTNRLVNILKEQNQNIREIQIQREFPNILRLAIDIRKPIAVLSTGSTRIGVDKEGKLLFGLETDANLVQIEATGAIHNITDFTDWRITKTALILGLLEKESILVDRIILKDSENIFTIHLPEGSDVLAPYSIDPYSLAASLQVILHRFRIEGKNISRIDFRFEKPIIQLKNEEKKSSP